MTLENIEKKSRALMTFHGLEGWDFAFDKGTRRLGCCHHSLRRITISREFATRNRWRHVQETMLHEIAHALLPYGAGHGTRWKQLYVSLGGTLNRDYSELKTAPKKWTATCPNCKTKYQSNRRGRGACAACCKKYNNNKFTPKYMWVWKENKR